MRLTYFISGVYFPGVSFGGYLKLLVPHEVIKPKETQKALNTVNCVLDPTVFNANYIGNRILHAGNTSAFFWLAGFQPEHCWAPSLRVERRKIYLKIPQKPEDERPFPVILVSEKLLKRIL